jgi:hypothetical protein
VPAVEKQGDGQVDALTLSTRATVQAAYSPANHLVLTGAYNNSLINKVGQKGNDYNYTSFGLGYYTTGSKNQVGVLFRYGFGMGRDNSLRTENGKDVPYYVQASYPNYQLQPYVRLPIGEGDSEAYFGFRNSVVQVTSFSGNDDTRINPGNHYTFEPFGGFRAGAKNLKLDVQLGLYSPKRTYVDRKQVFDLNDTDGMLNLHIGIVYNFALSNVRSK